MLKNIKKRNYFTLTGILFICSAFSSCSLNQYSRNYTNPDGPRYSSLEISKSISKNKNTLKVVTYNIKCSKKIDAAIKILKNHKQLLNADIICLQEMDTSGVKKIATALKYNYVYYPSIAHKNKNFGNAILTRWPILYDEKIILPHLNHNKSQRVTTSAIISVDNKKIKIFSVHLGVLLHPNQRGDQIEKIVEDLNPNINYFIIAGDFNTITKTNLKTMLEPLMENYFTFVTKNIKWTYKHWYFFNKKAALDHILTQGMKILDVGIVPDRSASDHIPVWAELKLLRR